MNYKTHFLDAKKFLCQVRGPTLKRAGFHEANALTNEVQEVKSDLQKVQSSIDDNQSVLQELVNHIGAQDGSSMSSISTERDTLPPYGTATGYVPAQQANAASNETIPPAILQYLQKLDAKLSNLENTVNNTT